MSEDQLKELIKTKDETIAQLNKVKDTLKSQFGDLKKENTELKKEIEELKKELEEAKKSKADDVAAEKSVTSKKELPPADEKADVAKLMEQLKNGMFKLGQQNHTITLKVEEILKKLSGGAPISRSKDILSQNEQTASTKSSVAARIAAREGSVAPVKKREYVSPGLMASNQENAPNKEEDKKEEVFHIRKPSDLLKNREKEDVKKTIDAPKVDLGASDDKIKDKDDKKDAHIAPSLSHGIKTVDYPNDGVIKCPYCSKQNFVEQTNKAKIIAFAPVKKYGKKYYCKECRGEWDYAL